MKVRKRWDRSRNSKIQTKFVLQILHEPSSFCEDQKHDGMKTIAYYARGISIPLNRKRSDETAAQKRPTQNFKFLPRRALSRMPPSDESAAFANVSPCLKDFLQLVTRLFLHAKSHGYVISRFKASIRPQSDFLISFYVRGMEVNNRLK